MELLSVTKLMAMQEIHSKREKKKHLIFQYKTNIEINRKVKTPNKRYNDGEELTISSSSLDLASHSTPWIHKQNNNNNNNLALINSKHQIPNQIHI